MKLPFISNQPSTQRIRQFSERIAALVLALTAFSFVSSPMHAQGKPPAHAYTTKHIYSDTADPKADIADALKQARKEHKRVLLDFGGDWCGDCQVLDIYFHQARMKSF